jgi:hypothetical protein
VDKEESDTELGGRLDSTMKEGSINEPLAWAFTPSSSRSFIRIME